MKRVADGSWKVGLLIIVVVCTTLGRSASGEETIAAGIEFFEQHIRPLLVTNCIKCHGSDQQKNDLRLDSIEAIIAGGESGPAIERYNASASLLLSAVRYDAFEMPPDGKLAAGKIAAIERWIELGAPWPEGVTLTSAAPKPRVVTDEDRNHWSFRPIVRPALPTLDGSAAEWCQNPIDRFVIKRLSDNGLKPAAEASRRTLIRRLYFDLLGIPPTPAEIHRFLTSDSANAYEQLVDQLLARPEYGERWATHWLDLVRYADSDGFRQDAYRPGAWHYRDYVIRSLNEDKPYDRFVAEQLAGDELFPDEPMSWVGTSFFRLQPYEYNQRDVVTQRQDILNDITDVTADVFLGLGMKCARCHDHKFDPILQKDYYRLQSHFAALLPTDDKPLLNSDELATYQQRLVKWEKATASIRASIAAIRKPYIEKQAEVVLEKFTPELRAAYEKPSAERSPLETQLAYFIQRQTVEEGSRKLSKEDADRVKELSAKLKPFDHLKPIAPPSAIVAKDVGPMAPATFVVGSRSDDTSVSPSGIEVLRHLVPDVPAAPSGNSTGRRTALARWLTSPQHPLTARVAVNRMWQHHFGQGLVVTPSDFGRLGAEASQPLLLDWLSTELIRNDWQVKQIHRLIVTSSTYRQKAQHPKLAQQEKIDPSNQLCWRAPVRRLDAEQIVDAVLRVSGQLNERLGGPSEVTTKRRAIYRRVLRNKPDKLVRLFDGPDSINSTPRRSRTITSTQALALLNGDFGNGRARDMSAELEKATSDRDVQIFLAYERTMGRLPNAEELRMALDFLSDPSTEFADFCHVLLNANEFLYVD